MVKNVRNLSETLEKMQELKYSNKEKYELLKREIYTINNINKDSRYKVLQVSKIGGITHIHLEEV